MAEPRSWLFVPADSEKKIAKALDSAADAIIFDLEDSVAPAMKAAARELLKNLPKRTGGPQWWMRVNPLGSEFHKDDLDLMAVADIHGIVLPKAESGADVTQLAHHPVLRRVPVETPNGVARVAAPPAIRSDGPPVLGRVPGIGEHTAAIRAEFTR